jgi:hypothetical protein
LLFSRFLLFLARAVKVLWSWMLHKWTVFILKWKYYAKETFYKSDQLGITSFLKKQMPLLVLGRRSFQESWQNTFFFLKKGQMWYFSWFCCYCHCSGLGLLLFGQPHYAAQASLNSWSACLSLLSAGITGMHHHTRLVFLISEYLVLRCH